MGLIYWLVRRLFVCLTGLFFREVTVYGQDRIPDAGGVIFVAAPHSNQFVDPMILMRSSKGRKIRFLMAASSFRRRFIGFFGRLIDSIPVERPADLARPGRGRIVLGPGCEVHGVGTQFRALDLSAGVSLYAQIGLETVGATVERVVSDTAIVLRKPFDVHVGDRRELDYSVGPQVDQSEVYDAVHACLHGSGTIAIFPEGGSHDRSAMLPLKAGVASMALGAMAKHPGLDLAIIPCGLNYFNPDRFRSQVVIEYGKPIAVDPGLIQQYMAPETKRQACGTLLSQVFYGLQDVTINLPDFETHELIRGAKELYKSSKESYDQAEELELTRRFAKSLEDCGSDARVAELRAKFGEYDRLLKSYGVEDALVQTTSMGTLRLLLRLLRNLLVFSVCVLMCVFMVVLCGPTLLLIDRISARQARKALAASSVKIKARDVIATWKIISGSILLPLTSVFWSVVYSLVRLGHLQAQAILLISLAVFPALLCLAVRAFERGSQAVASTRPLLMALFRPDSALVLRRLRHELKKELHSLVNELGPTVIKDFSSKRIVRQRRLTTPELEPPRPSRLRASLSSIDPFEYMLDPPSEG